MVTKQNTNNLILKYSTSSNEEILNDLGLNKSGLNKKQIDENKEKYGENIFLDTKRDTIFYRLKRSFINPYSIVLFILAIISIFIDIVFAKNKNYTTVIIILSMLLISGLVRFFQELKAKKIADDLINLINCNFTVLRNNTIELIKYNDIVVGDIINLQAGEIVPADIRILSVDNLFVSESIITGESEIYEKNNQMLKNKPSKIIDYKNTLFQGTTIISGKCQGLVLNVGKNTTYGDISLASNNRKKGFEKGSNSIVWVLIKFMCILVPIVFIASGLTKGNWLQAFLFSLSVAVGLTPELLPMVITACLAKGSYNMRKKETIVKNINAMEEFGSMDVLCVDKTGTLTQDKLVLEYYMDILGNEDNKSLNLAYLNSYFQTSFSNPLDLAILKIKEQSNNKEFYNNLENEYIKLDEFPFDYDRKIASVLLKHNNKNILISKGPVDDIIKHCKYINYKNEIIQIENNGIKNVHEVVDEMLEEGMKVLAIAVKDTIDTTITIKTESDLILVGYIAFFDSPKESSYSVLAKLKDLNINVKVLTGDNKTITTSICKRLGMNIDNIITGNELDLLSDDEIQLVIEKTQIFAELTPKQKSMVITLLQANGHIVGFLGDGINDMKAMLKADVSISVENAAPSLKDIADVILIKKDLNVLEQGVIEGRKAFNNMSKYMRITASSNLGNILAIVIASIFLPFFPITSIQLLLLNLLYDILCLSIPWDNVDQEMCNKPLVWSNNKLSRFMLTFGLISSVFDVITFLFLFLYLCPSICGGAYNALNIETQKVFISIFQTGWFLESMWTQVLIIHLLRTNKLPFIHSKPSKPLFIVTILGIVVFTLIAMTPVGKLIGLTSMPLIYFGFLIINVLLYLLIITLFKKIYIKKNKTLM